MKTYTGDKIKQNVGKLIAVTSILLALMMTFVGCSLFDYSYSDSNSHSHQYSAEQVGYVCDADGYVTYTCSCGNTFTINNYMQHVYVNEVCIYCGRSSLVTLSGYTFISYSIDNSEFDVLGNVWVILTDSYGRTYEAISDRNGYYQIDNIPVGNVSVVFCAEGYNDIIFNSFLNDDTQKDVYFGNDWNCILTGRVTIADTDIDYSNNVSLVGAKVTVVSNLGSNVFYQQVTTDDNGIYAIDSLLPGNYILTVEAQGYITLVQSIEISSEIVNIQNIVLELIQNPTSQPNGSASGMIYDSRVQGDVGVSGLTLRVRKGLNNITGEVVAEYTTGTNGIYYLDNLPAGNYTVAVYDERTLSDENQRYGFYYFNIKIIGGQDIPNQNGSVSNKVLGGQISIVLTWGATPYDLDSHLTGPIENTTSRFHVYFSEPWYQQGTTLMSALDRDDTDSYGPETITIYENVSGVYRYSVHDYSNRSSSSSYGIANSGAVVQVYFGDVLAYTFNAPNKAGTVWTVFEYDSSSGILTVIDSMSYQSYPGDVN